MILDEEGNTINKTIPMVHNKEDFMNTTTKYIDNCNFSRLILISDTRTNNIIDYIFYDKIPDSFEYNISNVNFKSVQVKYNNQILNINMNNKLHNYYIVNNKLDDKFIIYYLKNYFKINIDKNNFYYELEIYDGSQIITLNSNQSIIFQENNYIIVN